MTPPSCLPSYTENGNYNFATRLLFGDDNQAILDNNPKGFITKFFAGQIKSNALSQHAALAAFQKAREESIQYTAELKRERYRS